MATNRVTTRSKNSSQHPGLLLGLGPKQSRRTSDEVEAARQAKEEDKKRKEDNRKAGINRVAEFEQKQAEKDELEQTPRVQAVTKPGPSLRPLVRTRSYADVLRHGMSDIEMDDATSVQPPSQLATVEPGQTTDDGMRTEVQDLPPKKKKVRIFSPISVNLFDEGGKKKNRRLVNLAYGMPSRLPKVLRPKVTNARAF